MLFDFHDRAGAVQFVRVLSGLVLDADIVTHCQCGQALGVYAPVLMRLDVPFAECVFAGTYCVAPGVVGEILAGDHRDEVAYHATKYTHCW